MGRRVTVIAVATGLMALGGPAIAAAQDAGVPAELPAAPVDEPRLVHPDRVAGREAGPVLTLGAPRALVDPLLPAAAPSTARAEALRAVRAAGFVGGVARQHAGTAAPLRSWAVRVASPANARGLRDALRRALTTRPGVARVTSAALDGVPEGRVLTASGAAGVRAVVGVFPAGPWLYGVEAVAEGAVVPDEDEVAALARDVYPRQPEHPDAAPLAAEPLPVTDALVPALAAARAAVRGQRTRPVAPRDGTVQRARLGDDELALAAFAVGAEPELFRRHRGGSWRWLGDVGGPGCPRIPEAVREVWGLAGACPAETSVVANPGGVGLADDASPLHGIGMWVWEVPRSGGVTGIVDRARRYGLRTVHVKSGDGIHYWRQFDAALPRLKAAGLRVCGWQHVRGRRPVPEARIAARAIRAGADCFVVNAEIEFERMGVGRNSRAQRTARSYMAELRRLAGHRVPIGFTSFAYVDLHARFPYSAFLTGPHAAEVNMPQVYWGAFRSPVVAAMERTAQWNAIYQAPIAPIGGTYERERVADLRLFRCLAAGYGWAGVSYWSLQHTRPQQWPAVSNARACASPPPRAREYPELRPGRVGDPVLWLQERLRAWGYPVVADARYGAQTRTAVATFQRDRGVQATGVTTPLTWALLLEPAPG